MMYLMLSLPSLLGDIPTWLDEFTKNLDDWTQLSLDKAINMKLYCKLENKNPYLLDIRNDLFYRQCSLPLLSNKPGCGWKNKKALSHSPGHLQIW